MKNNQSWAKYLKYLKDFYISEPYLENWGQLIIRGKGEFNTLKFFLQHFQVSFQKYSHVSSYFLITTPR